MKQIVVFLVMFLVGCSTYNVQRYQPIDLSEKTVVVPPGGDALTGAIKAALGSAG